MTKQDLTEFIAMIDPTRAAIDDSYFDYLYEELIKALEAKLKQVGTAGLIGQHLRYRQDAIEDCIKKLRE